MNNNKSMQNWSEYLNNKAATKNPKLFTATFIRDKKGNLQLIGHQTMMLKNTGRKAELVKVNTRAFAELLENSKVTAL